MAPEFLETPKVSYDNNDTSLETKLQELVKKNKLHDFGCKLMRKDENGDFWYSCEITGEKVKLGRGKSEEKAKEDSLRKMVDELRKGYGESENRGVSTRGTDRSGGSYGSRGGNNGASGDRNGNGGAIWGRNDMGLNQNNRNIAIPRRNNQPSNSNNVVDLTGPDNNKPPASYATNMPPPNFGSMGAPRPNNPVMYGGNAPMSKPTVPLNWSNSSSVPPSSKLNHSIKNPIGHINEVAAKSAQKLPDFKLTNSGGPSHKPFFEMECRYQGKVVKAVASNKKDVKHNAAVLMLQQMGM